jgi:phosphotriesterase-related protein
MAQLALLKEQGIHPSAVIWVHAQNESDTRLHLGAAAAGAWVEYDGVAHASAEKHVNLVLRMKEAGHLGRVLISQDAGWYHVGEPAGGNFRPYGLLFTEFLPLLRKAGLDERHIETLLVRNPREALTLRERTLPMS